MTPFAPALFAVILWWGPGVAAASSADSVVYVVRRGWHIDIGFEAADLAPLLDSVRADFPGASALFFGFGDRRYLDSRNHGSPALLAALLPGPGVVLATALNGSAQDAFGPTHVIALKVSRAGALAIQAFIQRSLRRQESYRAGPYSGSEYFEATATYSGFYTCNTWASRALATGGLPIRARGTVFASQLWRQARRATVTRATVDAQAGAVAPAP